MKVSIKIITALFSIFVTSFSRAEVKPGELQEMLARSSVLRSNDIQFLKEVKNFYDYFHYNLAWLNPQSDTSLNILFGQFGLSKNLGLDEKNYQYRFIADFRLGFAHLNNSRDSILADIRITDAAIHFFSDVVYGNTRPDFRYNGLNYHPDCYNIAFLLYTYLMQNRLNFLLKDIEPSCPEYKAFKGKITDFNLRLHDPNF